MRVDELLKDSGKLADFPPLETPKQSSLAQNGNDIFVACDQKPKDPNLFKGVAERFGMPVDKMPNEMLMAALKASYEYDIANNSELVIEAIQRQNNVNKRGNGVSLPGNRKNYRNLLVSNYVNSNFWELKGEFFDDRAKQWRPFRYVAAMHDRELWVGERLYFPTHAQGRLIYEKLFRWAGRDGVAVNPLPEGFGTLSLQRAESFFEERKVYKLGKASGRSVADFIAHPFHTMVKAKKPRHAYYFDGQNGKTMVLIWDEGKDRLEMKVFMGSNQCHDPRFSGVINDQKARGLLLLIRGLKAGNPSDAKSLQRLEKKLEGVADFR